ncbi:MAG: DNA photolyase [Desulfococcaceae bacterium]|nr:DNA photolyase [Desulfococcaceae bacterium]
MTFQKDTIIIKTNVKGNIIEIHLLYMQKAFILQLSRIFIERCIADAPETLSVLSRFSLPVFPVDDPREVYTWVSAGRDPVQRGKEVLFLCRNRGPFIRNCPGTRYYLCCGYMILHVGTFCSMDCAYCILQSYFHPPVLQYFVNHGDMLAELDRALQQKAGRRFGTGEYTDSLIWEYKTDLSRLLVPRFAKQSYAMLELKSKTVAVENLKGMDHQKKTALSWSVNTEDIIRSNERGTASLTARLKAAARCESWGYPLSFHFDPIIIYPGCENDYEKVVNAIFAHVSADSILWISLGTFRFMPDLKGIVRKRFPDSKIIYGEFISGLDGKMRYFKPLRVDIYRRIVRRIREIAPQVPLYFCMEDEAVWEKVMGFVPDENSGGLAGMLDRSAIAHCGLDKNREK